jgi:voltage-gated potassium channel
MTPEPARVPPFPAPAAQSEVAARLGRPMGSWRLRVYTIIFEADTRAGRLFDLLLIATILASVVVVILDSVHSITVRYGTLFDVLEWTFTLLFTAEYLLRLACVRHPLRYATSFFGMVDLLAVLPTYLALFVPEVHALIDVRMLRLLRIFRILKLGAYVSEFGYLGTALMASRRKIIVFIGFVLITVTILGTLMYVVEGPQNSFTSIPVAIYWGITTMTTFGFGDITPKTDLGRFIASSASLCPSTGMTERRARAPGRMLPYSRSSVEFPISVPLRRNGWRRLKLSLSDLALRVANSAASG